MEKLQTILGSKTIFAAVIALVFSLIFWHWGWGLLVGLGVLIDLGK